MPQIEITPDLLAELRRKAEACNEKSWVLIYGVVGVDSETGFLKIAEAEFPDAAEHIAAASPAMVLALVAEIERLRKELGAIRKYERERWESAVKAFAPIQKSEAAGE